MTLRMAPLHLVSLVALGMLNAWLIAEIVSEPTPLAVSTFERPEPTSKVPESSDPVQSMKPIGLYEQIIARPLFSKSREPFVVRPVAIVQPVVPQPPPRVFVDPGLVVGGIIIKGERRKVYLFTKTESNGKWVAEGEEMLGWKVRTINTGMAKLEKDNYTIELQLYAKQ